MYYLLAKAASVSINRRPSLLILMTTRELRTSLRRALARVVLIMMDGKMTLPLGASELPPKVKSVFNEIYRGIYFFAQSQRRQLDGSRIRLGDH